MREFVQVPVRSNDCWIGALSSNETFAQLLRSAALRSVFSMTRPFPSARTPGAVLKCKLGTTDRLNDRRHRWIVCKETGLAAGDRIEVALVVNDTPRAVDMPDDFSAALHENPGSAEFFADLSNSLQRYHLDQIEGAKTDETRRRRIDKAIGLFLEGKKR